MKCICERKLELRSHNVSYCLKEVVTKAGLTVCDTWDDTLKIG